ncbi:MAG: nitrite reductase large subunit NirB [Planctomycetes bacterium]|nr:nitrite reductase large subunit NirB [Planctomycetota bacterium]
MNADSNGSANRQTLVVIGNGMVGLRFCEKLVEFDTAGRFRVVTFCEEPRAAYDRVGLTSFFAHRDAEKLMLARLEWYQEHGVELHVGDRATAIDRTRRLIRSAKGVEIDYDAVVLATGSYPFVPPVPGIDKLGVFVYRTIEDLERIIEYGGRSQRCAVIGGGLLGLEAAKAAYDLKLETHVVEFASRLMPRQIDDAGSRILVRRIEELGVRVHLNRATKEVRGNGRVEGLEFADGTTLDVDMIIVSAGIRPRDELARQCGLDVGQRGGIVVNDLLQTSDADIYAIGECALHGGMVYGLVAPGYEMAEIVAANLCGTAERTFAGTDLSTKLKLMGVDVASFGDYEAPPERATPLVFEDPIGGAYKKLLFSPDGKRLVGGVLVGDATQYATLAVLAKSHAPLPCQPHELIVGSRGASAVGGADAMPDAAQVCSCNNVTKGQICSAIREHALDSPAAVKACTKAGTGCGGCFPLVIDLFQSEMRKAGKTIVNHLCEHFPLSRTELFAIVRVKRLKSFADILEHCGRGLGCEICKPAVASILASLWNENVLDPAHQTLQDTNDRFLANMQRGGLYSIVPRVPGGEITPDKLIAIAETAKRYNLYTKITGGQRIDLFGAQLQDLPDIWERLVAAGMESGHAYGKALRTVKSCVGTTWCRYGVRDSVAFAIRIENRYKGIRAPHKIKAAVSGCVRECAEAQGKDFGLVATENGYNLYVCGNGGSKPRHADLLAADIDEDTAIRYIDRFLGYYISTADKLTRTSVWLEKLEGGIDHLREVILDDKLGLCAELEDLIQGLVDTYQCEWAAVVRDPDKRKWFRQFVNTDETEPCIEIVSERGQCRPGDWPGELVSLQQFGSLARRNGEPYEAPPPVEETRWLQVGTVSDFPIDGGATIKYGKVQIAVFNFTSRGEWYATQNMCPHKKAFVLSRGIVGDAGGMPKVACPLHKKTFSLEDGRSLAGEEYRIRTFPVRVEGDAVYPELPPTEVLDEELATEIGCRLATSCETNGGQVEEICELVGA